MAENCACEAREFGMYVLAFPVPVTIAGEKDRPNCDGIIEPGDRGFWSGFDIDHGRASS
jgi:hypothetical protein